MPSLSPESSPVCHMTLYELHQSLAHLNYQYLEQMAKNHSFDGIVMTDFSKPKCTSCLQAKARHTPIALLHQSPLADRFGNHVHMDVWGPASVMTIDRCIYYLMLINNSKR
ncbi:hypothetical protein FOMPIDRAFT_1123963 [Fomitopsis schrenkii]|uniref:GAG-pre-integrase domain-containing protein n=1 Tax=Fomitopsis schrenkii TaxID=2126942 RepID=S8E4S3_FOMSC|nr:hypothetical protein FOMPIDRAFT_1123963 [Fomitopsis schrenkii]